MSHVFNYYDLDLYASTLLGIILSDMAMSRWNIIHENRWSMYELDYPEFVANFSFILPENELENTREDYLFLRELITAHWAGHDYSDVMYPPVFNLIGGFYVFEIVFESPGPSRIYPRSVGSL